MDISQIEKGYDIWSDNYDSFDNPMIAVEEIVFYSLIDNIAEGMDVLDVGCGTGRNSFKAANKGANVTGIDLSTGMLDKAKVKLAGYNAKFLKCDLKEKLPFDADTFDVVLASLVLEHIEDIDSFFREVKIVCKKDGRILISEMHPYMFYKNIQAHFKDSITGEEVIIGSYKRSFADFINSVIFNGLKIEKICEYEADEKIISLVPKAAKHAGQPMLFTMQLKKD